MALQRAGSYLRGLNHEITSDTTGAELDEIAFIQFVLAQAATYDEATINNLYNVRDRMSPSSQALLASIINSINPADERTRDLISNLEANAITTASGAHWETPRENIVSRGSPIYTTSLVVYVLSQLDSANQVLFNAVNYLAAHRNASGLWSMGHDNAWAMLALNEAMLGFGDLNADFKFNATFNGGPLLRGDVSGNQVLTPSTAQVPLEYLSPTTPNLLTIQRTDGHGTPVLSHRAERQPPGGGCAAAGFRDADRACVLQIHTVRSDSRRRRVKGLHAGHFTATGGRSNDHRPIDARPCPTTPIT